VASTPWKTVLYRQLLLTWGQKRDLLRNRPGSFPFVSGDTFREICEFEFLGQANAVGLEKGPRSVFSSVANARSLAVYLKQTGLKLPNSFLIIHNGDALPDTGVFESLCKAFNSVFSVNVTPELETIGVIPVPIGLENAALDYAGRLKDYPKPAERRASCDWSKREIDVLASFRVETNPSVRLPVRDLAEKRGVCWVEPSGDQRRYLQAVAKSRWILSPRGNGADCHRTWEAIYHGAIPVVEANTLGHSLFENLPVFVVESFTKFLAMNEAAKTYAGQQLLNRSTAAAFMPYWCWRLYDSLQVASD